MIVCQHCTVENELDTWFEAPTLEYLVCPRCAGNLEYARPITVERLVERILELKKTGAELHKRNQELTAMVDDSPDLVKQLRRLVREAERMCQANEQVARMLTELTNNLSPRWAFEVGKYPVEKIKAVMGRMATEAGPGAILAMTEEEMSILQSVKRL